MKSEKPLIIAHRGASHFAPENTLAAFQQAIVANADGIEFDVRLSKDNIPVVFHDANLRRLAKLKHRVVDLTAEELSQIDVGSWFNRTFPKHSDAKFSDEKIPTLAALLEFLKDYKCLIYIELKGGKAQIRTLVEAVCGLLESSHLLPNIIIKSFNLEVVKIAKQTLPNVRTAALFEPKILTILRKKKRILEEAARCNADEISIHFSMATKPFVSLAKENNFPVVIWTANNRAWVKRAVDFGISAIITNKPAQLLAERENFLKTLSDK